MNSVFARYHELSKPRACVICLSLRLRQITQTSVLIIHDIMTSSNNCLLYSLWKTSFYFLPCSTQEHSFTELLLLYRPYTLIIWCIFFIFYNCYAHLIICTWSLRTTSIKLLYPQHVILFWSIPVIAICKFRDLLNIFAHIFTFRRLYLVFLTVKWKEYF